MILNVVVIHGHIFFLDTADQCIRNNNIEIRPSDLPWYNSHLHCLRRKVFRAHEKVKMSGRRHDTVAWSTFCRLRNDYQEQLKAAEHDYNDQLRATLNSATHKKKSWWRTVKYFLNRNHTTTIPSY